MAKKKDATQVKGVSDKDKNLKPDTQEEELKTKTEEEKTDENKDRKAQETADALSDREKAIEEMANRLETERSDDETGDEKSEENEDIEPEDKEEGEEKEEEEELPAKEDEENKDNDTLEIIVDGVKKKVPVSQVTDAGIRALQKESAADVRLEEAVKLLKEAKEAVGTKDKTADTDEKTEEELKTLTKGIDKEKISKIREAIQYGEEEEAQAAIEELISLASNASKIPDNVMTVEKYKEIETEKTAQEILKKFNLPPDKGGFSDIVEDRYLYAACREDVQTELDKGTPNTWELYESVGKNIRQWRDKKINALDEKAEKEADAQRAKDELTEKREKKAKAAGTTVIGVNAKTETTNKEPKEQSVSDVVKEMRIARGQPV